MTGKLDVAGHYHFYLDKSYTGVAEAKQFISETGVTVCFDLMGNTFTTDGRSMIARNGGKIVTVAK